MNEDIFFYANGRGAAHRGEVLETNDDTVRVIARGPGGFEGRVFEVPRSEVGRPGRSSGRPEK